MKHLKAGRIYRVIRMDPIVNFILQQQQHLSPDTHIQVSVGKYLDYPNILDTRLEINVIKEIVDELKKSRLVRQDNAKQEEHRIYKHQEMEYSCSKSGEKATSKQVLDLESCNTDNVGLKASLQKIHHRQLEEFPCLIDYIDIVDTSRIIYNVNNMFEIIIVSDIDQKTNRHTRIELVVACQNIYVDKIKKALEQVFTIIHKHLNKDNTVGL